MITPRRVVAAIGFCLLIGSGGTIFEETRYLHSGADLVPGVAIGALGVTTLVAAAMMD